MTTYRITVEHSARVYDDDGGWYVSVGPDGDGLDLCQISYVEDGAERTIIIPWPHAEAVAGAIFHLAPINRPKASQTRPASDGEASRAAQPLQATGPKGSDQ